MSVANKVKGLMKTKGLKNCEVADYFKISTQALRNKLNRDSFSAEDLIKIADCLGLELAFSDETQKTVLNLADIERQNK